MFYIHRGDVQAVSDGDLDYDAAVSALLDNSRPWLRYSERTFRDWEPVSQRSSAAEPRHLRTCDTQRRRKFESEGNDRVSKALIDEERARIISKLLTMPQEVYLCNLFAAHGL